MYKQFGIKISVKLIKVLKYLIRYYILFKNQLMVTTKIFSAISKYYIFDTKLNITQATITETAKAIYKNLSNILLFLF